MAQPISIIVQTIDEASVPCWPECADKTTEGTISGFAILEKGTAGGKASVAFKIDLGNDTYVLAQLTQGQFEMLAACLKGAVARFEELKNTGS